MIYSAYGTHNRLSHSLDYFFVSSKSDLDVTLVIAWLIAVPIEYTDIVTWYIWGT